MRLGRRQRRALRGELNRVTGDRWTDARVAALPPADQVRLHRTLVAPVGRRAQDLRGALQLRLRAHGGGDLLPDAVISVSENDPDEGWISAKLGATTHLTHHHVLHWAAPHDLATATARALGIDEAVASLVEVEEEDVDRGGEENYSVTWWAAMPRRALTVKRPRRRGRADLVPGMVVGDTRPMRLLQEVITRVAPYPVPVIVHGETGTGKEMVAEAIHRLSKRSGSFVPVNCAALTPTLINSTLFGHVRGAFTGAERNREGAFVAANGGTLFLDEIGELPPEAQAILLRVLQEGQVRPVGADRPVSVNVRIVAASHKSLWGLVQDGSFREDLFYRLNGARVSVPPLRERAKDLPQISAAIIRRLSKEMGFRNPRLTPEALEVLGAYDWPGNIRELRNVLVRSILFSARGGKTRELSAEDVRQGLPRHTRKKAGAPAVRRTRAAKLEMLDRRQIADALESANWNKAKAARLLGVSRSTLYDKMSRYGMD